MTRSAAWIIVATTVATLPARRPPLQPTTVTEYVAVAGLDGASIGPLRADDLEVLSDGVPVASTALDDTAAPLSLLVLIDASASMPPTLNRLALAKTLDSQLFARLRRDDRVRVGSIASRLLFESHFTADRIELRASLDEAITGNDDHLLKPLDGPRPIGAPTEGHIRPLIEGPSPIWDGLWEARLLLDSERRHRTILLVTDGKASGNTHGFDDTLHALALGGVTVSVVGEVVEAMVTQVGGRAAVVQPNQLLQQLASQTGGLFFTDGKLLKDTKSVDTQTELPVSATLPLEQILERLMTDFQQAYAVSFPTLGDGEFHRLAVRSRRAKVVVRARPFYFAPRT